MFRRQSDRINIECCNSTPDKQTKIEMSILNHHLNLVVAGKGKVTVTIPVRTDQHRPGFRGHGHGGSDNDDNNGPGTGPRKVPHVGEYLTLEDRYKFDRLWQVYMDKVYDSNQDSSDSALSPVRSPAVSSARSCARSRLPTMSPVRPTCDKPDAEAELVDKPNAETSRRAE